MPEDSPIRVFISYAREDADTAATLYADLKKAGLAPWMDTKDLLPGADWLRAVEEAIKGSRYFIALLSQNSVTKNGVVQKELRRALDRLEEYPPSAIYLVPVRIERCEPSYDQLRRLYWLDLFPSYAQGLGTLLKVLQRDVQNLEPQGPSQADFRTSEPPRSEQNARGARGSLRLQMDLSPEVVKELEGLQKRAGLKSKRELFNAALSLLEWASREVEAGRAVGSVDEFNDRYKVLEMPVLRGLVDKSNRRGPA